MKPIEAGCKAIIFGSRIKENNGKEVIIREFIGSIEGFAGNMRWRIDRFVASNAYYVSTGKLLGKRPPINHSNEKHLLRIDGDEEFFKEEAAREKRIDKLAEVASKMKEFQQVRRQRFEKLRRSEWR